MLPSRIVLLFAAVLILGLPSWCGAQDDEPAGPVLTKAPTLVEDAIAEYPQAAIDSAVEGDVQLQLTIGEDGSVTAVSVVSGPGSGLDEAAVEAAQRLLFTPAEVDGQIQAIAIHYTFSFLLADVRAAVELAATGEIAGIIQDRETGEPLSGVTVSLGERNLSMRTGLDGGFEFRQVNAGEITVVLFLEGYHRLVERVEVGPGERIEVVSTLSPEKHSPNLTVVRGRKPWREVERAELSTTPTTVTSHFTLTRRDIDFTPGGMEDVIQAVGRQPGVVGDSHYGQFWIRGGDSGDTVFYLDGVALYNPYHMAGFNSVFNPELLDTFQGFTAAAPAVYRDSLSGVLDVRYLEGTPGRWDGAIDVSILSAKAYVAGAIGPRKRSTIVLGGRRTYMEPFFAVMRAVGLAGDNFLTPQFGELYGRYVMRPGDRTRIRLSAAYTDDLLHLEESEEGDDPTIDIEGKVRMKNRMFLMHGDFIHEFDKGGSFSTTISYLSDASERDRRGAFDLIDHTLFRRTGGRMDLHASPFDNNMLSVGMDVGWLELFNEGDVLDERWSPTWAALPLGDYGQPSIHVEPKLGFPDGALYVEDDWLGVVGGLDLRAGLRWSFANPTHQQLVSPRLGLAYNFKSRTTVKLAGGMYHQSPLDTTVLDPTFGNADIRAERNVHLVLGIDQLLPFGALLRAEGYYKWMDRLVVNPDTREAVEAGTTFTNDGTGWAAGMDLSYQMRTGRVSAVAQYSLLFTRRTNPLNEVQPVTVAPGQDQRHTTLVGGNVVIGPERAWIVSLSYQFHSGRPVTPTQAEQDGTGGYQLTYGELNSERYGTFHEINFRSEVFRVFKKSKFTAYVEVMNMLNFKSDFVYIWGDASVDDEGNTVAPERGVFTQIPIRPFFGMRLEF